MFWGICFYTPIFAQEYLKIEGILYDNETKKEVQFANIGLLGTNIQSFSNEKGEFSLIFPNIDSKQQILISHINYKNYTHILENNKKNLSIFLIPNEVILSEVVIKATDVNNLWLQFVNNKLVEKYITNDKYIFTAYYENKNKNSNWKYGLFSNESKNQAIIKYKQDSKNIFHIETLKGRVLDKSNHFFSNSANYYDPNSLFRTANLKKQSIFDLDLLPFYALELDTILRNEQSEILVITFNPKSKIPKKVKPKINKYKIWLEAKNLRLVKIQKQADLKLSKNKNKDIHELKRNSFLEIKFDTISNGIYYPQYIKSWFRVVESSLLGETKEKLEWSDNFESELFVTDFPHPCFSLEYLLKKI